MEINDDVPLICISNEERNENTRKFRLLAFLVVLEIVLVIVFTTLCLSLPSVDNNGRDYFWLVYGHLGFWGLAMLLERFLRRFHKKLKLTGYLLVHIRTRKFNKTLGLVLASGNLLLLTLSTVYLDFCTTSPCQQFKIFGVALKRINYLQIIVLLESLVAGPMLAWYLAIIIKLIRSSDLPDVLTEDFSESVAGQTRRNGLNYCPADQHQDEEVMERQADVIRCLRERNLYLAAKIQTMRSS